MLNISLVTKDSRIPLIGDKRMLLPLSKTKVNADHAGPFQLLELLKVSTPLKPEPSLLSLNNNSLIAQAAMETKVAMED
jgi:hypothetical protein